MSSRITSSLNCHLITSVLIWLLFYSPEAWFSQPLCTCLLVCRTVNRRWRWNMLPTETSGNNGQHLIHKFQFLHCCPRITTKWLPILRMDRRHFQCRHDTKAPYKPYQPKYSLRKIANRQLFLTYFCVQQMTSADAAASQSGLQVT